MEKITILLVEDNPADVLLTKESFEKVRVFNELNIVENGIDAMSFLLKNGNFSNAPTPDLILLDLNLPGKSGMEILEDIKSREELKSIPVVILTSSEEEEDILKSYKLHASAYVTKPINLEGFGKIVSGIEGFWFSIVRYPEK